MLINKYYDSSEQEEKKNEYYIQELQKYIHEKNISSKDADQLNRWVEQQKVLHVRVYKGDIVVFESEYPEQKLWEEEIPANEYEWMDYYPIEFADGSAQVNIWGIYDYQFYHYAMIVEVLFSFLLFLLLVLIGIRRKMDYILQLSKEIQILEGGSLEYAITVKGKDELAKLAEGIENMRKSFQRMIHKETEIVRENQKIVTEMSHDLRTPMTTVNGYAKALADGMVVEPEKQLEYLQAIQNKSARMNDLIHLLFEYVKLDSEGFSLDRKETDLSELLRENAALIYADFEDAGMEFEIDIPEEVVSVSVDSIQFSRVITNLLNNAMKHNESGTHIKIGMYRKNGYIYILVADSGRRIPGELAEHLFEPFTKGDVSRKSGSGSGLGLSIAKKIIEMHGFQMDFIQQLDEKKILQIAGYTKEFVIQIADDSYDSSLTA